MVKQAAEARDWTSSVSLLDAFYKQFQKGSHLSIRTGSSIRLFVRTLVQLAAETDSFSQEQGFKKQMSTTQAKGFNSLTQRLKKHLRIIDPAEIVAAETAIKSGARSESDSEQSSDDVTGRETSSVDPGEKSIQDIMDMPKEDVTFDMIDAKVTEIALSRGKKGVDRTRAVQQLSYVLSLSKCAAQEVEILLHIISAQFDLTGSMSTFMSIPVWRSCLSNVLSIMKLLESNGHISLVEEEELAVRPTNDEIMAGAAVQIRGSLCAFAERLDDEYTKSLQCLDAHTKEYVSRLQDEGGLLILIQQVAKFYEEKSQLKAVSNLSLRLLERLHCKTNESYEALKKYSLSRAMAAPSASNEQSTPHDKDHGVDIYATSFKLNTLTVFERIEMLAAFIYKSGDERAKARALLCQIFSQALRGGLEVAKELLLMSHLQEIVQHMDISTQILFNRTIAQLGLCAFELGRFDQAAAYLSDLFAGGCVRELLAQGVAPARFNERSAEQEKLERRRQTPQHLHINLELLESVFLVCAMLLEISDLVRFPKFRSAARNFTRVIEHHNRQLFMGPPDGVRDTIISAAKLLLSGDYEGASNVVLNLPVWNSLLERKDKVLSLMDERLKIEATRLYLHQFAEQYSAASTNVLAEMVSTTDSKVCSVVNSMIANEEIPAMLNNARQNLLLWKQRQSQLQNASSTYSEKVLVLLDASERALEQHIGGDNSTCREDDEPTSRRRPSSKGEPEEYESRRSRAEDYGRRYIPMELERSSKTRQLDSYGNFFPRKAPRDFPLRGGGKRVHK